jgi:chloramphenicol-sensitive protein RarD
LIYSTWKRGAKIMNNDSNQYSIGVWYTIVAYLAWGFLPLYWKLLDQVPASEILAHRVIWSFVFVCLILAITSKWDTFKLECRNIFSKRNQVLSLLASSLLISVNWFIYIWAVNTEQVVEASLGYYINPLLSVLLGIVVLKERLTSWQLISFALATIGVAILAIQYGKVPWIAISLAMSFALYGLAKKITNLSSLIALTIETLLALPIALLFISSLHLGGTGSFAVSSYYITLLLIGAGVSTALPLLFFAQGARRIPLSMIGFLQYIAPTISLVLGIFIFKESFTKVHLISFIFIWAALTLYSISRTKWFVILQNKESKNKSLGV